MRRTIPFLLVGAYLLTPALASAQSEWEQQVLDQIRAASNLIRSEGFDLRGDAHTASLDNNASEDVLLHLQGGVTYALIGVCDADCSDIDLSIADEYGNLLDSDYEDDDLPILEITPTRTGSFRVHVYMASCSMEPCFYGLGTFESDEGVNEWQQQVQDQVYAAGAYLSEQGYSLKGQAHTGSLDHRASADFTIDLQRGFTYTLLGVCDEDCSDIDLSISDENGEEIDSDYKDDDVPILEVTPGRSGNYRVHVYMAGCTNEPCYYGVATFFGSP